MKIIATEPSSNAALPPPMLLSDVEFHADVATIGYLAAGVRGGAR